MAMALSAFTGRDVFVFCSLWLAFAGIFGSNIVRGLEERYLNAVHSRLVSILAQSNHFPISIQLLFDTKPILLLTTLYCQLSIVSC